jgi:hypothetical protein
MSPQLIELCDNVSRLAYRQAITDVLKFVPEAKDVKLVDLVTELMRLSRYADVVTYSEIKNDIIRNAR